MNYTLWVTHYKSYNMMHAKWLITKLKTPSGQSSKFEIFLLLYENIENFWLTDIFFVSKILRTLYNFSTDDIFEFSFAHVVVPVLNYCRNLKKNRNITRFHISIESILELWVIGVFWNIAQYDLYMSHNIWLIYIKWKLFKNPIDLSKQKTWSTYLRGA